MKCPRCVQRIHRGAEQCPHCGFALSDLDAVFGAGEVRMRRLSDAAGVLRLSERKRAEKWFDRFEQQFPQLFFSVYYGALDEVSNMRQFGIWLLNRGAFEDVDLSRPNEGGVLLLVDVNSKTAFMAHGYLLDFYLREKDSFKVLSKAHPHLLKEDHCKALKVVISELSAVLRQRSRSARRRPRKYQKLAGCLPADPSPLLEPLRATGVDEHERNGGGAEVRLADSLACEPSAHGEERGA
ncbi:hypothetical protein HW115_17175 [Verrucomicrobiaceae bacterium N1E253]|uniref:TPM domain-containing protein n=1 Tax=Oceaniferula marina TaxID=2748318 RepID=A0A851GQG7_9BACT|nr:hypothetical protein [Oceaniferula marina]NWK57355.1 hypothetical protein [Oceaniferula marina]